LSGALHATHSGVGLKKFRIAAAAGRPAAAADGSGGRAERSVPAGRLEKRARSGWGRRGVKRAMSGGLSWLLRYLCGRVGACARVCMWVSEWVRGCVGRCTREGVYVKVREIAREREREGERERGRETVRKREREREIHATYISCLYRQAGRQTDRQTDTTLYRGTRLA
jgi:hypothetical protein